VEEMVWYGIMIKKYKKWNVVVLVKSVDEDDRVPVQKITRLMGPKSEGSDTDNQRSQSDCVVIEEWRLMGQFVASCCPFVAHAFTSHSL